MEQLIVPDDSRHPVMAFESSNDPGDDHLVVVFEDGTMGIPGDFEEGDLRGGTSYNRIYRNIDDIRTEPTFNRAEIDSEAYLPFYYRSQIPILAITIFVFLVPFLDDRLAFSTYEFGFLLFPVAVVISYYPEIKLIRFLGSGAESKISIDVGEVNPIILSSFGRNPRASRKSKVVGFGQRYLLGNMFFLKTALPVLTLEGSTVVPIRSALFFVMIGLVTMPAFLLLAWYETQRKPGGGEVAVEHATTGQVHEFVRKKWLASSLEGLLKLKGESKKIEFKSSLWYDYDKANPNSKRYQEDYDHTNKKAWGGNNQMISMNVVKTVAGFLNAGIAGTLLIGVDDDNKILGLEKDFELCAKGKEPEDEFTRKLEDLLEKKMESLGKMKEKWTITWLGEDARVCRLDTIEQDEAAVWVKTEKGKLFYIRRSNRTEKIDQGIELSKEIRKFATTS